MKEPIFLKGAMQDKIWGGTKLHELFGYDIPTDTTGEYWAISAHENGMSYVTGGPFDGLSLKELWTQHPELFNHPKDEKFPLLVKIIDAKEDLSVQVHPNNDYAKEHAGELGKTECWYILDAEPNARIVFGHKAQTKEELEQLVAEGKWDELLAYRYVKPGEFYYVQAGLLHAIGAGVTLLEVQQSSDTTYRFYDYDRTDANGNKRPLHLEDALNVTLVPAVDETRPPFGMGTTNGRITLLLANDYFAVEHWQTTGQMPLDKVEDYTLLSVIKGHGTLQIDDKTYPLEKGVFFILPKDVESFELDGEMELIVAHAK
ncbi:mannose-6-phosphate isomerase, class I [Allofustis seminis]|uniref:mannose-6-phosphate isomerase, class I n=1 Tax=Allofustis seminis TaxID=166939 RepID=UPI0003669260|nr:mannose-6-phosphate isomerase, class I [Allofustis seminis]